MTSSSPENTPDIQVDSDWKAQAQAEKEQLAQNEQKVAKDQPRGLPPADFQGLLGLLASQAMMGLGMMQDPSGKGVMIDLDGSKFAIDLLDVIYQKTTGNLTDQEDKELSQLLTELRARFVQVTQLIAEQAEGRLPAESTPGDKPASSSPIITP